MGSLPPEAPCPKCGRPILTTNQRPGGERRFNPTPVQGARWFWDAEADVMRHAPKPQPPPIWGFVPHSCESKSNLEWLAAHG